MQIGILRLIHWRRVGFDLGDGEVRDLGLLRRDRACAKANMPRASKRQRNEPARVHPADAPSSSSREQRAIDHTAEIQDELLLKVRCQGSPESL